MPPFRTVDHLAIQSVLAAGYEVVLDPIIEVAPRQADRAPGVIDPRIDIPNLDPSGSGRVVVLENGTRVEIRDTFDTEIFISPTKGPLWQLIDSFISERHQESVTITEYPVETGFEVADHSIVRPRILDIVGFSSDAVVGWVNDSDPEHIAPRGREAWEEMRRIMYKRELVTLITRLDVYRNMIITDLETNLDASVGDSLPFRMTLKEVRQQYVSFRFGTQLDPDEVPSTLDDVVRATTSSYYTDIGQNSETAGLVAVDYDGADQYAQTEISAYVAIDLKNTFDDVLNDGFRFLRPASRVSKLGENFSASGRSDIYEIPLQDKQRFYQPLDSNNLLRPFDNNMKVISVAFQLPQSAGEHRFGGQRRVGGQRLRLVITVDKSFNGDSTFRYQIQNPLLREVRVPSGTEGASLGGFKVVTAAEAINYPPGDVVPHFMASGTLTVGQLLVANSAVLLGEFIVLANKDDPVEFIPTNRVWDDYDFLFVPDSKLRDIQRKVYRDYAQTFIADAGATEGDVGYIQYERYNALP